MIDEKLNIIFNMQILIAALVVSDSSNYSKTIKKIDELGKLYMEILKSERNSANDDASSSTNIENPVS